MNQPPPNMLQELLTIQNGIQRLGRNCKVVLPHHTAFELTDDLEERIAQLIDSLQSVPAQSETQPSGTST